MIDSSQVFELTLSIPAHPIARAVEPFTRLAKGIGYETL